MTVEGYEPLLLHPSDLTTAGAYRIRARIALTRSMLRGYEQLLDELIELDKAGYAKKLNSERAMEGTP